MPRRYAAGAGAGGAPAAVPGTAASDEAGVPDEQVQGFLGSGMIFSVMLAIGMPSLFDDDQDAASLLRATFGEKCMQVVALARAAA